MTGSTLLGCTLEATPDPVALCGVLAGTTTGRGVWVSYTPAQTGAATFTTAGSTFDTVLSVHSTCPTSALPAQLACNDDGGPNSTSAITFDAVAGTTYYVNIRGYSAAAGNFQLNLSFVPECPADWNNSGALSVQDIFDFLAAFFAGAADFNLNGQTTVQDIFDFLTAYFAGC
jgi:hypothetical protein